MGSWHGSAEVLITVTVVLRTKAFNSFLLRLLDTQHGPVTPFAQFNVYKLLREHLGVGDWGLSHCSFPFILMMSYPRLGIDFSPVPQNGIKTRLDKSRFAVVHRGNNTIINE